MTTYNNFNDDSDKMFSLSRGNILSSVSSNYLVENIIGSGSFARVARCVKSTTQEKVALRIVKVDSMSQARKEEITLLKLRNLDPDKWNFVRWHKSFFYGKYLCQELELLDISLSQFVRRRPNCCLQLKEIRPILYQLATTLEGFGSLGMAHTDLKPQNIMLVDYIKQPLRVKVIDLGSATETAQIRQGALVTTRFYRSPEVILGLPCTTAIDMWSLGCIAVELFQGHYLFPGLCDYQMLQLITQTLGPLPDYFHHVGIKSRKFYDNPFPDTWTLKAPHEYGLNPDINCKINSLDCLKEIHLLRCSHLSNEDVMDAKADMDNFLDLIKGMLQLDPRKRITPHQVKQHPFMANYQQKDFTSPHALISASNDSGYMGDQVMQQHVADTPFNPKASHGAPSPQKSRPEEDKSCVDSPKSQERKRWSSDDSSANSDHPPVRQKFKIYRKRSCEMSKGNQPKYKTPSPDAQSRISQDSEGQKRPLKRKMSPESKEEKNCTMKVTRKTSENGRTVIPQEKGVTRPSTSEEGCCTVNQERPLKRKVCVSEGEKDLSTTRTVKIRKHEPPSPKRLRNTPDVEKRDTKRPNSPSFVDQVGPQEKTSGSQSVQETFDSSSKGKEASEKSGAAKTRPKIWVIGSSYIVHGKKAAYSKFGKNFGLQAEVQWFGKRGAGWLNVLNEFHKTTHKQGCAPDILVIHAGGNDLGLMSPQKLAAMMTADLMRLRKEYPSMKIVCSCINERQVWRYGPAGKIDECRKTVNKALSRTVVEIGGELVDHPLIRYYKMRIFAPDGVHFSKKGNEIFVSSIHTFLMKILQERQT